MDDRRDQDDARGGAIFEPAPLRPRGPPPVLVAGVVLAIGTLVVLVGLGAGDGGATSVAQAPRVTLAPAAASDSPRPRHGLPRGPSPTLGPADVMLLDVRPDGRHLFVHGDVFSLEAFIVVISLEERGAVTATRTIDLPGGSTAFLTGANPRFHVRFDLPTDAPPSSLWVRANGYDRHGDLVVSLRQPVPTGIRVGRYAGSASVAR